MPCRVNGEWGGGHWEQGFSRNCDEDGALLQEQLINTTPLSDKGVVLHHSLWGVTMEEEGEELDEGFNPAHFFPAALHLSIIP